MMRALVVRHLRSEDIGGFALPIEAAGYAIERIDAKATDFDGVDLLAPDLVVLMGGPMGVYEVERNPWIPAELARLSERLAADRPTFGVCLGAQMIAAALGMPVYPGPVREVGFAPVTLTAAGAASPLGHIDGVPMLHWHGDSFDLPPGTELLASTDAYRNQAFRRGRRLLALQCHAEMGEDPGFAEWLTDEAYIRSAGTTPQALAEAHDRLGPGAVAAGRLMIAEWLGGLR